MPEPPSREPVGDTVWTASPERIALDVPGETPPVRPYMIAISGGSASGKTAVSERIIRNLDVPSVVLISMDSFYRNLTPPQREAALANNFNFDHPEAFDYDACLETLSQLWQGGAVDVPVYNFSTHSRCGEVVHVAGANVVIFEGIFALYDKRIRSMMDLRVFVDTDHDIRLARRLRRDIAERGRDIHGVLQQYRRFVKPAFDEFIGPTMRFADVIIPRGVDNLVAVDLITKHVSRRLHETEPSS